MKTSRRFFVLLTTLASFAGAAAAQSGNLVVPLGGEFTVTVETYDQQNDPVVAARPGGFVVVWESYYQDGFGEGVFARLVDSAGTPLGGDMQVNLFTAGDEEDPAVGVRADGSFVVVWDASGYQDGDERGIFGRLFDSNGQGVGDELAINEGTIGDQNDAVVAVQSDGSFLVVWESYTSLLTKEELVGRRFDSTGTPLSGDFPINVHTAADQEDVAIGVDASDRFVVVWESDGQDGSYDSIVGRRLASDGSPLGTEFLINTYTLFPQVAPDVAVRDDGSFVVVWTDFWQDPTGYASIGRLYDSSPDPVATTGEFQIDSFPSSDQAYPSAAFTNDGDFVVVWMSWLQDGSGYGVYRDSFDSTGNKIGTETLVNTTTSGSQEEPKIAIGADSALVVWTEYGCCGDVKGQAFLPAAIFADGFESGDVSAWSSSVQ